VREERLKDAMMKTEMTTRAHARKQAGIITA